MIDKNGFEGIKLAFETQEQAKQFEQKYEEFMDINPHKSFKLISGGYRVFGLSEIKDAHVLELKIDTVYELKCQSLKITGETLLEELEEFVDITDTPQDFRGYPNQLLTENELPEQFRCKKGDSSMAFTP